MFPTRSAPRQELNWVKPCFRKLVEADSTYGHSMLMPRIGAVRAVAYLSAVDAPGWSTSSKKFQALSQPDTFANQSWEWEFSGGITEAGAIGVILRRIWFEGADFRSDGPELNVA